MKISEIKGIRILFVVVSLCGIILLFLSWRRECVSALTLLASVYSYPDGQGPDQARRSEYMSVYRRAWLGFISESRMKDDGSVEFPGGQSMNKAVEDAHVGAWKIISRLENMPIEQRREAFVLLQVSAGRELSSFQNQLTNRDVP
jgi:hypothetical protein